MTIPLFSSLSTVFMAQNSPHILQPLDSVGGPVPVASRKNLYEVINGCLVKIIYEILFIFTNIFLCSRKS